MLILSSWNISGCFSIHHNQQPLLCRSLGQGSIQYYLIGIFNILPNLTYPDLIFPNLPNLQKCTSLKNPLRDWLPTPLEIFFGGASFFFFCNLSCGKMFYIHFLALQNFSWGKNSSNFLPNKSLCSCSSFLFIYPLK